MTSAMIVEDDPSFFQRFGRIVGSGPEIELPAAMGDGASAMQSVEAQCPGVPLDDLGQSDTSGIEVIREAARRYLKSDIMVVAIFGNEEHVLVSIVAGATGYPLKDSLPDKFIEAVKQLRVGGSPIRPVLPRQLRKRLRRAGPETTVRSSTDTGLSLRESEILSYISKGFSFAEIARLLEISPHTVVSHVKKIYQKLAVHSRGEAVYEATRLGLVR